MLILLEPNRSNPRAVALFMQMLVAWGYFEIDVMRAGISLWS